MKRFLFHTGLAILAAVLLAPLTALAAVDFTVTMPGNQSVTMRDPLATLTFRITNTGTEAIDRVTFTFPGSLYYVEWNTVPPAGWTFNAGGVTTSIQFDSTANGYDIPVGGFLDFPIIVKGPNWTDIVASNSDQTDTLSRVVARGTTRRTSTQNRNLPGWLRRSLAVTLSGYPGAVGIGRTFSLSLQIENRSTNPKNNIAVTPDPPGATFTGGAAVTNTGGPAPGTLSLAAGQQGTITYTYQAAAQGTVSFTASAANSQGTSASADSNTIVINALAVSLSVVPVVATSGQSVVVTMTVQNTGRSTTLSAAVDGSVTTVPVVSTAAFPPSGTVIIDNEQIAYTGTTAAELTDCTRGVNGTAAGSHAASAPVRSTAAFGNVAPTLTALGTAAATLLSGPSPLDLASVALDQSAQFTWVYRVTGTTGQTYQFQGFASANGSVTSNTATSEQGTIGDYSVTVDPSSVGTGSTNVTIGFTFFNGTGGSSIRYIYHYFPDASWNGYQGASVVCSDGNSNWTVATMAGGLQLVARNNASRLDAGQSCTFNLRFSSLPYITNDTSYAFYSDLYDQNGWYVTTLQSVVTITAYRIVLVHSPAGPLDADGTSAYTITATMTAGGAPLSGLTIVFTTTAGTLSAGDVTTDASGQAAVTLLAPVSSTDVDAVVSATYFKTANADLVSFRGVNAANLQYIGGSLVPVAAVCAGSPYSFSLQVKNYGTAAANIATPSTFTFTDGSTVFTAYLDAAANVAVGATATLSFGSSGSGGGGGGVTVGNAFTPGSYQPRMNFTGTVNQTRLVSDAVTVLNCTPTASGGRIRIIRWREIVR